MSAITAHTLGRFQPVGLPWRNNSCWIDVTLEYVYALVQAGVALSWSTAAQARWHEFVNGLLPHRSIADVTAVARQRERLWARTAAACGTALCPRVGDVGHIFCEDLLSQQACADAQLLFGCAACGAHAVPRTVPCGRLQYLLATRASADSAILHAVSAALDQPGGCTACGEPPGAEMCAPPQVLVKPAFIRIDGYVSDLDVTFQQRLRDNTIAQHIDFFGTRYQCTAIICRVHQASHFVAYLRHDNVWYEYNDMAPRGARAGTWQVVANLWEHPPTGRAGAIAVEVTYVLGE
jgi:hypothetical protein